MVTGQEMSSDLSIASRLASLKSDHIPQAPVRSTATPGPATPARLVLRRSAASTIAFGSAAAPGPDHGCVAVGRDRDAGPRRQDPADGGIVPQHPLRAAIVCRNSGAVAAWSCEWTATWSA